MTTHTTITPLVLVLALAAGCGFGQRIPKRSSSPVPSAPRPAAQTHPNAEFSPEQRLPTAPQVTCAAGQVTLSAENSTLDAALWAVASCTNAAVDVPPSVGDTRVAARLGPASPREVFSALLDGSLDYVILGSEWDPAAVSMVQVRLRQAMAPAGMDQAQPPMATQGNATTFIDHYGVERLPSGLTPEEALMTPQELAAKFEASREQQRDNQVSDVSDPH
jgi:hypothetical protein